MKFIKISKQKIEKSNINIKDKGSTFVVYYSEKGKQYKSFNKYNDAEKAANKLFEDLDKKELVGVEKYKDGEYMIDMIKLYPESSLKYPFYQVTVYDQKNDPIIEKEFQNKEEAKKYFYLLKKKYKNKNDVELYEQKSKDSFDILETYNSTKDVRKNDGGYKQGYKDGKYMYKNHQPEDPDDIHEQHSAEYEQGYWDGVDDAKEEDFYKSSSEQPTTPKPTATLPDNMVWAWDPKANQWIAVMKDNPVVTPPTYNPNNITNTSTTTQMYTPIKSTLIDSLNQFLNGDRYSREIKIEKGLISDGLIKLAGINPIKGPKYSITDKGLQVLKQAAQEEYDFEKDYIKARKSYLLDGISEEEFKTGTPESQGQMPKFSIFEKDGSELAQIEAKNSTDAKVKFFMENPEYEGSQTISVKKIDSTYSETTMKGLDFPNQPISPSTDIKVDTHGWVNQAADDNIDKKQTLLKTLVYQQNKKNGDEGSIGLNLDFDNKAVATGDLESLSEIETKLKDNGIACNITHREDFPEMYELTVFYTPKSAPTDKFAGLEKKAAENPIVFSERPEAIKFEIDENYLFQIINQHPKLSGVKLDPKMRDNTYTLEYKLSSDIKWSLWLDMRNWGITEMRPGVMDQTISIDIDYSGEDESPIKNGMYFSIEVPIKDISYEITTDDSSYNQFFLKELEIYEDGTGKAIFQK